MEQIRFQWNLHLFFADSWQPVLKAQISDVFTTSTIRGTLLQAIQIAAQYSVSE
jgi:hypothetical protein